MTVDEKFPIEDGLYDCVLCIGCITTEHINLVEALGEFHRLLKTNGVAVYTVSPTLDKVNALSEHIPFLKEQKFELLRIEKHSYFEHDSMESCYLYGLRKL